MNMQRRWPVLCAGQSRVNIAALDSSTISYYHSKYDFVLEVIHMDRTMFEKMHQINYLTSEMDALYHHASLKLGISDSVCRVLYTIYDSDGSCPLSDIYTKSGISKQTVNSAMRNLERDGMLYLEQLKGRAKLVQLTDKGREYAAQTVARIYDAEIRAFECWTEAELDEHIRRMEQYANAFRRQIDAW